MSIRSDAGQLVQNSYGKLEKGTDDDKLLFNRKDQKILNLPIDVLIDSSGSQAGRQPQVAAQGYIISEAMRRQEFLIR